VEKNYLEQRHAFICCVRLWEGATGTYGKVQKTFGKNLSRTQVFRCHKDFVNGRQTVEDERRSGRPASVRTSTNFDRVGAFIPQGRRLTIRMIADELDIN
jgi:hypothetical protein